MKPIDLTFVGDLASALTRDLARDLTRILTLDLANALASDFTRANALDLARTLARALIDTSSLIVSRNHNLYPLITITTSLFIRAFALAIALSATFEPSPKKGILPSTKKRQPAFLPSKSSLEMGLDIFELFQLLELRMQGTLPACEGILIVKEKKETSL